MNANKGLFSSFSSVIRMRKPVLVQKFADQTIQEGETLELQIKHIGSKPITVTWYRDDEVIHADDRCKLLSDDDIHLLKVDPVEIDDEAIYKCLVKNPAGQDLCEAKVLVQGSISDFFPITVNNPVLNFSCLSIGFRAGGRVVNPSGLHQGFQTKKDSQRLEKRNPSLYLYMFIAVTLTSSVPTTCSRLTL